MTRTIFSRHGVVAAGALVLAGTTLAGGKAEVIFLPSGSAAYDVSADGSVVVGISGGQAFRWTQLGGIEPLPGAAVGSGTLVGVSGDGAEIGADILDANNKQHASLWNGAGWDELPAIGPSCDSFLLNFYDLDFDGNVAVGLGWVAACRAHAFRWDPVNGTIDLGTTVENRSSRANGVDDSGDLIVGWQDLANGTRQGAYWTWNEGTLSGDQTLVTYESPGGQNFLCGEAQASSPDGQVIVGINVFGLAGGNAWRLDRDTNETTLLPQLAGFTSNNALVRGITADKSTIVGSTGGFIFGRNAIIWIDGAAQRLKTYVEALGGVIPYTDLGTAMDISDDGRTIVGFGAGPGQPGGWIVRLPADDCTGDLDGNGTVDGADLGVLLAAWGDAGGPADLDGNGTVDGADLGLLLAAWGEC